MNNIQAVGGLLRALDASAGSPLAPTPVASVNPVRALRPLTTDGTGERAEYRSRPDREADVGHDAAKGPRMAAAIVDAAIDDVETVVISGATARSLRRGSEGPAPLHAATPGGAPLAEGAAGERDSSHSTSASLQLSSAAQIVRALLQVPPPAAGAIAGRSVRPLLAAPPTSASELASAFARAVSQSGVFYESHLAAWAAQKHPAADLNDEPQAQWRSAMPQSADELTRPAADDAAPARSEGPLEKLPEAAVPLLRQQLATLETGQVLWQGNVWPHQEARLVIADEDPRCPQAQSRTWRAELDVVLPALGTVRATLSLRGQALQLEMSVEDPASVELLHAARVPLIGALSAHALEVTAMKVGHEPAR